MYKTFPRAFVWNQETLDFTRVDAAGIHVSELLQRDLPESVFGQALESLRQVAALETGAIENLYELDRGITITAATQGAMLDQAVSVVPEKARALIEAQLNAYQYVLDFVTGRQPLGQAWIRQLHEVVCAAQDTYAAYLPDGTTEQRPLCKGEYKNLPNHVLLPDKSIHYYAPPEITAQEMQDLLTEITSSTFDRLHPVDQCAYTHYAFVAIHPFQDGNGRVARALASVSTYRQYRVPLLITSDQKRSYFKALASADRGDFAEFRRFVAARIIDSVDLLRMSVRDAFEGSPELAATDFDRVYRTRGGYSHLEIDARAAELMNMLITVLNETNARATTTAQGLRFAVGVLQAEREMSSSDLRRPVQPQVTMIQVQMNSAAPAEGTVAFVIAIAVPVNAASDDVYVIDADQNGPSVQIPVDSVLPSITVMAEARIRLYAADVIRELIRRLQPASIQSMRNKGYFRDRT